MAGQIKISTGMLTVEDLRLSKDFDLSSGQRSIKISGPTCTICSECCLSECTGGY
jgi:hypothetical protein